MACAGVKKQNSSSVLDKLDPNELIQPKPQRKASRKGTPQNPTPLATKLQRKEDQRCDPKPPSNPVARQNPRQKPHPTGARHRNHDVRQDKGSNGHRPSLPSRLQNNPADCGVAPQEFCNPPSTCSGATNPCLTPCSGNDLLNKQMKQMLQILQTQPPATCPSMPPKSQSSCTPIPSKKNVSPPVKIVSQSNQRTTEQDNVICSTPMQHTLERSPHTPEIAPRPPTSASNLADPSEKLNMSLPPPPGLPKPKRKNNRDRPGTRPVNVECHPKNEAAGGSHNGPVAAGPAVVSPPPAGATPSVAKLPATKDTQQTPGSPASTTSALSEDLFGGSSVQFSSDTSYTSVSSAASSNLSQNCTPSRAVCRNWMRKFPCRFDPCPFRHPERTKQPANPSAQPVQSRSGPPPGLIHPRMGDHQRNFVPRKDEPPSRNIEQQQRPVPLYAATISDHIKVRFDQGFEVREVVTGFESRWVHLGNVDTRVTSAKLSELLGSYKVDIINFPELRTTGKPMTVKVQFSTAEDAIKAVTDLNGSELAKRRICARLAINNSTRGATVLTDTDVQIVWECPFRAGYAGYDTLKEAKVALDTLNGFPLDYLVVSAELYEGLPCVGAYNVIFKQLPASMNEQEFRKFAKATAVMMGRPKYQSLDKAVNSIRSRLEEYGTVAAFDVLPPPYKDGMVKAWARFTSHVDARDAQADMDHRHPKFLGLTTISCRHVVSVSHVLSAASYRKMREDIGWLRWSWQRRYGPSVSITERFRENGDEATGAFIRLSSEQSELLSGLKYEFEQLLHGETIMFEKKPLWDDFLIAEAGRAYISEVQGQYRGVQIQVQGNRRVISLWGPIVLRHRARQDIVRKIMELKALQFWKIPLSGKLLSIFCSAELITVQELLGPENCMLDLEERVLVVRGNDEAFRIACTAIQDIQSRQGDSPSSSNIICPVCFGEPVVPMSLACGHQWCRTCLTSYLTSAVENKMFPLRCLGNDAACTECIPLGLSRRLLSAADFNAVIEAAFWVYVHGRPDEFHHCPTPDCMQVYRSAPPNAVLQCPSCLVHICPACHIEYHDGMTCAERDVAEDKLFSEWTSNHDVKSCPGCKVPIERSEGCNHMTCTRCQAHICWECLATFPRGQGIYDHMRIKHGGIGL